MKRISAVTLSLSDFICCLLSAYCLMQVITGKVWFPETILVSPVTDCIILSLCFLFCVLIFLLLPFIRKPFTVLCSLLLACLTALASENEWLCLALCALPICLLYYLAGKPDSAGIPGLTGKSDSAKMLRPAGKPGSAGIPGLTGKSDSAGMLRPARKPSSAGMPRPAGKPDSAGMPGPAAGPSLSVWKPLLISGAVLFFLFVGCLTRLRYYSFRTPNFDFGIFAQMLEQMRRSGLPFTTCERNRLLSHFAVHISPVWYLLLPFYLIFPHPVTLQLFQAAIVTLAVIPLYKLARLHLSERNSVLLCLAFFLYPALSGSCFYDIHENCFLTLFLLWMIYESERRDRKLLRLLLPAVLTCLIKEDAPIFVAVFGFYRLFEKEKRKEGVILFALGCAWFGLCLLLMNRFGEGVFAIHYDNLLYSGHGMIDVILVILCDPVHAIAESFSADRILYLAQMLVPLCFLPLLSRRPSGLILLIPFFLINLMPDYTYQHTLDYQYNFGNAAFFFYLTILALKAWPKTKKDRACTAVLIACLVSFCGLKLEKLSIVSQWYETREECRLMQQTLDKIPAGASAAASSMLTAHLWQLDELYQLPYAEATDYVALDLRYESGRELQEQYKNDPQYRLIVSVPEIIELYRNVTK